MSTERDVTCVGFTSADGGWAPALTELAISPRQRLDDAIAAVSRLPFGNTDCALPMEWARETGRAFDTFVVLTDNETWAGAVHPHQALVRYRERSGIDARLVVVGMTATDVSIADPADGGMLDVAGFDAAAPGLIADFSRGDLG
jgi:60 kDa SS-A/Ro ribonucleoprotein